MRMQAPLQQLGTALERVRGGELAVGDFSAQARQQQALLAALPPRYGEVLLQLLDRLESSALFSEESCSFSQRDLLDSVRQWLDQAQERLARD